MSSYLNINDYLNFQQQLETSNNISGLYSKRSKLSLSPLSHGSSLSDFKTVYHKSDEVIPSFSSYLNGLENLSEASRFSLPNKASVTMENFNEANRLSPSNKASVSIIDSSLKKNTISSAHLNYYEAPARLKSLSPKTVQNRSRSMSLPEAPEFDCFIHLETSSPKNLDSQTTELSQLVIKADYGMKSGIPPILAEGAMGGTYFLRDRARKITVICKPGDEEPNSPNNPYKNASEGRVYGTSYKGNIVPGFGMYREVVACLLDNGFSGIPPTQLGRIRHQNLFCKTNTTNEAMWLPSSGYKTCSVQSYVRHDCSAEDMGPIKFDTEDIHRIAIQDVRLCNLDRHEGNMLVCKSHPYQQRDSGQSPRPPFPIYCDKASDVQIAPSTSAPTATRMFFFDQPLPASPPPPPPSPGLYRLVPIDHGYVLPHVLHLSDTSHSWLQWPQVHLPLSSTCQQYINNLCCDQDIQLIKRHFGAAIPDTSLLTLRVCTALLQRGSQRGLTLYDIGTATSRPATGRPSPLQEGINSAVQSTLSKQYTRLLQFKSKGWPHGEPSPRSQSNSSVATEDALHCAMSIGDGKPLIDELLLAVDELIDGIVEAKCRIHADAF